jgi:hypothetical protein
LQAQSLKAEDSGGGDGDDDESDVFRFFGSATLLVVQRGLGVTVVRCVQFEVFFKNSVQIQIVAPERHKVPRLFFDGRRLSESPYFWPLPLLLAVITYHTIYGGSVEITADTVYNNIKVN